MKKLCFYTHFSSLLFLKLTMSRNSFKPIKRAEPTLGGVVCVCGKSHRNRGSFYCCLKQRTSRLLSCGVVDWCFCGLVGEYEGYLFFPGMVTGDQGWAQIKTDAAGKLKGLPSK